MCNGMIISNILYRYISEVGFTHLNPFKEECQTSQEFRSVESQDRSGIFSGLVPLMENDVSVIYEEVSSWKSGAFSQGPTWIEFPETRGVLL